MRVQIACVQIGPRERVWRSTSEGIAEKLAKVKDSKILFEIEGEALSGEEELVLWLQFVAKAAELGKFPVASTSYEIFFRKGRGLWMEPFKNIPNLAVFTDDDMIVEVPKRNIQ